MTLIQEISLKVDGEQIAKEFARALREAAEKLDPEAPHVFGPRITYTGPWRVSVAGFRQVSASVQPDIQTSMTLKDCTLAEAIDAGYAHARGQHILRPEVSVVRA